MKTALLITLLSIAFVGCSKSSKSQNCEYNGQKVDCSQMPSLSSGTRSASDNKASTEVRVEVSGKSRYEIKDGKFVFLDEVKKTETKYIDGKPRACIINIKPGLSFEADANERELIFANAAGKSFYERTEETNNHENYFIGRFYLFQEINRTELNEKMHQILIVTENEIEIHNTCVFDY